MNAMNNTAPIPAESSSESLERPRLSSLLAQWHAEQDMLGRLMGWLDRASQAHGHQLSAEMGDCLVRRGGFEDQIVATRTTDVAQMIAKLEIGIGNARDESGPSGDLEVHWMFVESVLADLSALAARQTAAADLMPPTQAITA
jgi:hypothetical protein